MWSRHQVCSGESGGYVAGLRPVRSSRFYASSPCTPNSQPSRAATGTSLLVLVLACVLQLACSGVLHGYAATDMYMSVNEASVPKILSSPPMYVGVHVRDASRDPARVGADAIAYTHYVWPTPAQLDYLIDRGLHTIRVTFSALRMYQAPGAELDQEQVSFASQLLNYAAAYKMTVILVADAGSTLSLYDNRLNPPAPVTVGSAGMPASAFVEFWRRMALKFKHYNNVQWGLYDVQTTMSASDWSALMQDTVTVIRAAGSTHKILISPAGGASAPAWTSSGNAAAFVGFTDPANNFAFDVRTWLNPSQNAVFIQSCTVGAGSTVLANVATWARTNGFKLLASTSWYPGSVCDVEGAAFLSYVSSQPDVFIGYLYFAAGRDYWTNGPHNIQPNNFINAVPNVVDRPQMGILLTNMATRGMYPPSPPSPVPTPQYKGVNLDGAEYSSGVGSQNPAVDAKIPGRRGTDFAYPRDKDYTYFAGRGMNIVRFPFTLPRLQPTLHGPLDAGMLALTHEVVQKANRQGLTVLLDPHDFGKMFDSTTHTWKLLGVEGGIPGAAFADFWARMAVEFVQYGSGVQYGLMNEPESRVQTPFIWRDVAIEAFNAIRATGSRQHILLQGTFNTGAHSWITSGNAAAWTGFSDPVANNFAFELHQYFDSDSSGTSEECSGVNPNTVLVASTEWAIFHGFQLFMGEMAVAPNAHCMEVGQSVLDYMHAQRGTWRGYTWWSAGEWVNNHYMFNLDPNEWGPPVQDREQMPMLMADMQRTPNMPRVGTNEAASTAAGDAPLPPSASSSTGPALLLSSSTAAGQPASSSTAAAPSSTAAPSVSTTAAAWSSSGAVAAPLPESSSTGSNPSAPSHTSSSTGMSFSPPPVASNSSFTGCGVNAYFAEVTLTRYLDSADSGLAKHGSSLSISADGLTRAVGAPGQGGTSGSVFVMSRQSASGAWTNLVEVGRAAGSAGMGSAVALSANGLILAVGASGDSNGKGATFIFTRPAADSREWSLQSKLVAESSSSASGQGFAVSLSASGSVVAVGAKDEQSGSGAVWVFARSDSSWFQVGCKLLGSDVSGAANFGTSISFSGNAALLVVGAPKQSNGVGAAYVFTLVNGVYVEVTKLSLSAVASSDNFATSVSVSSDGTTVAVGVVGLTRSKGGVLVYTTQGSGALLTLTLQTATPLMASDASSSAQLGSAVALSSSGAVLLVGGRNAQVGGVVTGAAWIFVRVGSVWSQAGGRLWGADYSRSPRMGQTVAVAGDASVLAFGGPFNNWNTGAAWFATFPPVCIPCPDGTSSIHSVAWTSQTCQ